MKVCFKCGVAKDLGDFYKHPKMADGHLGKCKDCTKKDMADRLVKKREAIHAYDKIRRQRPERKVAQLAYARRRRNQDPEKYRARYATTNAVRDGRLIPKPCEVCGTMVGVQAHHDDYSKPLDVRWFCFKHHREHHGQTVSDF